MRMLAHIHHGQQADRKHIQARLLFHLFRRYLFRGIPHIAPSAGQRPTSVHFLTDQQNLVFLVKDNRTDIDFRYLGERFLSIGGVAPVVLGACAAGADPTDVCLL